MKQNWEYKKLGDVVSFVADGDWIESRHQSENGFRLIQTGNVGNGFFKAKDDKPHYISEETFKELGCTEIFEGDCLVSRLPDPIGRACIIPNVGVRMITAVDCTIIRFKDSFFSKFFVYYTRSKHYKKEIEKKTTGSTRKRISRKNLESVSIPIPPLAEQQRIVGELDLLTGIIDKQNAQLKELDTLAQSIFYDMFGDPIENPKGWEVKKIGDVATVKIGPFGSLLHAKDYVNGGHPVINPIHLNSGKIFADESFTVDDAMYEQMQAYKLQLNDVVFGRRGDIGRCALVEKGQEGYLCGTGSLFVRFNEKINPTFSIATLMHKSITDYLVKKAKGATMLNINCGIVEDIPIILPPLALQQSFAEKIQSIEKQKSAIKASIADTQKLLDYTMDKYFG